MAYQTSKVLGHLFENHRATLAFQASFVEVKLYLGNLFRSHVHSSLDL